MWVPLSTVVYFVHPSLLIIFNQVKARPLSFTSAAELIDRIELLPKTPSWKYRTVTVEGGTTKKPITLYYRNGLECFRFLFGNPLFQDQMDFKPYTQFEGGDDGQEGSILYGEIASGKYMMRVQVCCAKILYRNNNSK